MQASCVIYGWQQHPIFLITHICWLLFYTAKQIRTLKTGRLEAYCYQLDAQTLALPPTPSIQIQIRAELWKPDSVMASGNKGFQPPLLNARSSICRPVGPAGQPELQTLCAGGAPFRSTAAPLDGCLQSASAAGMASERCVISDSLLAAIPDDSQYGEELPPIKPLLVTADAAVQQRLIPRIVPKDFILPRLRSSTKEGERGEDLGSLSPSFLIPKRSRSIEPHVYQCEMPNCRKIFPTKSRLNRHAVVHTGDRPFACPAAGCTKMFSRRDNMMQHFKSHSGAERRGSGATSGNPSTSAAGVSGVISFAFDPHPRGFSKSA